MAIEIWCWGHDERDYGHVAIKAENLIWGFFPTDEVGDINAPIESPGDLRRESEDEVADYYAILYLERIDQHLLTGRLAIDKESGVLLNKEHLILPKAHIYDLNVSARQRQDLFDELERSTSDLPNYNLRQSNCVTFSINRLISAGIMDEAILKRHIARPSPRMFLRKLESLKSGKYSGILNGPTIKRLAWKGQAYTWVNELN